MKTIASLNCLQVLGDNNLHNETEHLNKNCFCNFLFSQVELPKVFVRYRFKNSFYSWLLANPNNGVEANVTPDCMLKNRWQSQNWSHYFSWVIGFLLCCPTATCWIKLSWKCDTYHVPGEDIISSVVLLLLCISYSQVYKSLKTPW